MRERSIYLYSYSFPIDQRTLLTRYFSLILIVQDLKVNRQDHDEENLKEKMRTAKEKEKEERRRKKEAASSISSRSRSRKPSEATLPQIMEEIAKMEELKKTEEDLKREAQRLEEERLLGQKIIEVSNEWGKIYR